MAIGLIVFGVLVAGQGSAWAGPVGAAPRREYAVPASIDGTGANDVTDALNAFIKTVPNHSTVRFPSARRYRIEGTVLLNGRVDLIIEASGATFFATTDGRSAKPPLVPGVSARWPRHRTHWLVYGSSNIVVRNIVIVGANARAGVEDAAYNEALEAQSGFEFSNTRDSSLEGCSISNTYGDHVYVGGKSANITVSHCTLQRSGRQSISVTSATNVVLDGNVISRIRRSAFDLEPGGKADVVSGVSITNNRVSAVRLTTVAAKGQGAVNNVVIANTRLTGTPFTVVDVPPGGAANRRHDWRITGNVSDTALGSPHASIWVMHTDNVRIDGNTQPLIAKRSPKQLDVELVDCTKTVVTGNAFPRV